MTVPGGIGFSRGKSQSASVPVAILAVDAAGNKASGMTRRQTLIEIDLSYHVGSVQVTPSTGEQWYVKLMATTNGTQYVLDQKIPFNTPETLTPTTEGQQQIGTGNGPVQLHGTQVNANGPLRLASGSILDGMRKRGARRGDTGTGLPDPTGVDSGSMAYDEDAGAPTYSDGESWKPLATSAQVQSKYTLPPGGIPSTDLGTTVQNALTLAGSALQNIPSNSVGSEALQPGAVGTNALSPTLQTAIGKANTALQNLSGSPYDLSWIGFGQYTTRAVGYGDNPFGINVQRAITTSKVTYRCITADPSGGNLIVELHRNGTAIPGTSVTIAAANQVAGGSIGFNQVFNAGDVITAYITSVGPTPGLGLAIDVLGVMN